MSAEERPHSDAGPSSFQGIIDCAAMYSLSKGLPSVSTVHNRNGTLCHNLSESYLKEGIDPQTLVGSLISVEGHDHEVTQEMVDAVHMYVNSAWSFMQAGDMPMVEVEVDLAWIHPIISHGSVDFGVINMPNKHISVLDLKYGTSPVKADSVQFNLYTLGLIGEHNKRGLRTSTRGCVQPRDKRKTIPKVRTVDGSVDDLYRWVDDVARPACERALAPNPQPTKCKSCFFCRAKGISCPLYGTFTPEPMLPMFGGVQVGSK